MVLIRSATLSDTAAMAELLNEIIRIGGTTALTTEISGAVLADWMKSSDQSAWHVATDESGRLMGFQWIGPHADLPNEACDIATFVRVGETGLGIGSRLFEATLSSAEKLGYEWINANIRTDNTGGRAYYQSRGFRIWGEKTGVKLADGSVVNKVLTRFDLKD